MSYISEIFERLDIQHIREFLLHGVECVEISPQSYEGRIDETRKLACDFIRQKFPDMDEYEEMMNKVYNYAGTCEAVFMEIGLQCGFILAMQTYGNIKTDGK